MVIVIPRVDERHKETIAYRHNRTNHNSDLTEIVTTSVGSTQAQVTEGPST